MKPGPEMKKLDMFVGEWTYEEQGKDGETGEEWTDRGTGQYSKMGEFFYVWRAKGESGSFLGIDGYDLVTKGIVRHGFSSTGWRGTGTVTLGDKTMSIEMTGVTATGKKTRSGCTGDLAVPTSTYACEDLMDGKWVAVLKGTETKVK